MGCGNEVGELERIVEALRGYLCTHRQAADTLEGIKDWWLPREGLPGARPDVLLRALENLVNRGELGRVESANGRILYVNLIGPRLH